MLQDVLSIICISFFTAFLGEGIGLTWLFVYRTEKYQKLKAEVDKQSKRLEKQRDVTESAIDRAAKKRLEKQEERFKNINRELSMVKMKSMFAVGLIFTSLFNVFSSM
ncbi:Calcium load-activated calcium channel like [Schistosoma japonicum]|nr:Calcium load-activated calcium channel like [Schistosoma japonicum]